MDWEALQLVASPVELALMRPSTTHPVMTPHGSWELQLLINAGSMASNQLLKLALVRPMTTLVFNVSNARFNTSSNGTQPTEDSTPLLQLELLTPTSGLIVLVLPVHVNTHPVFALSKSVVPGVTLLLFDVVVSKLKPVTCKSIKTS